MIHATTWMKLENILLSEKKSDTKVICWMIPIYEISKTGKSREREHRLAAPGLGCRGVARDCLIGKGFWVMVCLELNKGGVVQHCVYSECYWFFTLKWLIFHEVNFTSINYFYFNRVTSFKNHHNIHNKLLVGSMIWYHFSGQAYSTVQYHGLCGEQPKKNLLNSQEY